MSPAGIAPDPLFVVSGGGRGITAHCVVKMAERYRCRFLLLGRTLFEGDEPGWARGCDDESALMQRAATHLQAEGEKPTPQVLRSEARSVLACREIRATLEAVRWAGGVAEYFTADITDEAALAAALTPALERLGPATGLLHGAGVLADKLIERKTEQDFDAVYSAKVKGLENLLACLPPKRLTHVILFSSAAGFYGNPGQSDYALANEALNRIALRLQTRYPAMRALSINWGPWEGGMAGSPEVRRSLEERGIRLIPEADGAQRLIDLLERDDAPVQALVGYPMVSPPRQEDATPMKCRLRRRLTLEANPFLQDHKVNDHPVLPFVCCISWFANACEQILPGYKAVRTDEIKALKGIVFDGEPLPEFVLDLEETGDRKGDRPVFLGTIWSQTPEGAPRFHYTARVTLGREMPPAPRYPGFDLTENAFAVEGSALYGNGTLFHGPAFQGVNRVMNATPERLTMRCVLPQVPRRDQGQFPAQTFNPFLADVQFQSQVIWCRMFQDSGCMPLNGREGLLYRPLSFGETFFVSMEVRESNDYKLVSDIYTHDRNGILYNAALGAEVILNRQLRFLSHGSPEFRSGEILEAGR
jgi:NAD(P)-dependent dehydrogenase (short-subunit alcohol dehydrogenase family)